MSLDDIRQKLEQRIKDSRVSGEMQSISGQFFAGTIWKVILKTAGCALATVVVMRVLVAQFPACTQSCFFFTAADPCLEATSTFTAIGLILALSFVSSLISTKLFGLNEFQISAFTSTFILLAVGASLLSASVPLLFAGGVFAALFLALFAGYRLGL